MCRVCRVGAVTGEFHRVEWSTLTVQGPDTELYLREGARSISENFPLNVANPTHPVHAMYNSM